MMKNEIIQRNTQGTACFLRLPRLKLDSVMVKCYIKFKLTV